MSRGTRLTIGILQYPTANSETRQCEALAVEVGRTRELSLRPRPQSQLQRLSRARRSIMTLAACGCAPLPRRRCSSEPLLERKTAPKGRPSVTWERRPHRLAHHLTPSQRRRLLLEPQ